MSMFKMPTCVGEEIKKIQWKLFWGLGTKDRKIAWVQWEKMCQKKEKGGLGIKDIKSFNMALLGKCKWRLGTEKTGLWKDIIDSMYRSWRNLNDAQCPRGKSLWWRDLKSTCGGSKESWFDKNIKWKIGSGTRIKF